VTTTVVHLLRHGEVHNPEGVLYGRRPGYPAVRRRPADGQGRRRRAALPGRHRGGGQPVPRAQETAEPISDPRPAGEDRRLAQHRGQASSLRAVAVGAVLWVLGHWPFARSHGYYTGALGRRVVRSVPLPGLDPLAAASSAQSRRTCRDRWP